MKNKYLLFALSACLLVACQKNEPVQQSNDSQPNSETIAQLGDFVDGIGTIVETVTLQDGSVVMKDDQGNTITKDKDGNVTIVTKDGETFLIDNSIKEDKSAPKDKWFNTTWKAGGNMNEPMPGELIESVPVFIERIQQLGFIVEQNNISRDTTFTEQKNYYSYFIHFNHTTASLQQVDTLIEYTYTQSANNLKMTLFPGVVGDGEMRYKLDVTYSGVVELYEQYYYYNYETGQYELENEWKVDELERYYVDENNSFVLYQGTETTNISTEVVSASTQTTWFNYRRLDDTQLAASNNSLSYLLKEGEDEGQPLLKVLDLNGNYLAVFELISL